MDARAAPCIILPPCLFIVVIRSPFIAASRFSLAWLLSFSPSLSSSLVFSLSSSFALFSFSLVYFPLSLSLSLSLSLFLSRFTGFATLAVAFSRSVLLGTSHLCRTQFGFAVTAHRARSAPRASRCSFCGPRTPARQPVLFFRSTESFESRNDFLEMIRAKDLHNATPDA